MSTLGVLVISGSAEFLKVVLSSAKVSNTILTENDFKQTIAKGLKDAGCSNDQTKAKLKPASLVNEPDNGIGVFKGPDDFSLPGGIKVGDFKGVIEIVKMELKGVATDPTRDFVVYYKKKNLGKLSARDPQKCTGTDVTGCFFHSCTVDYDNDNKHCTGAEVNCHNFSKTIITDITNKVSEKITETIKEKDCPTPTDGDPQGFIKGFDDAGNPDCVAPTQPEPAKLPAVTCPTPGEFLRGFDADGNPDCQSPCYGGQIYYESIDIRQSIVDLDDPLVSDRVITQKLPVSILGNNRDPVPDEVPGSEKRFCECPANKPDWNGTECKSCTNGARWVKSENACMSCTGGIWVTLGDGFRCDCPSGHTKKKVV